MLIVAHYIISEKDAAQRNFWAYVIIVSGWTYYNTTVNKTIIDKEQELRQLEKEGLSVAELK